MFNTIESLESRSYLSGLTVITHGMQPDNFMPAWEVNLADSIGKKIWEQTGKYPSVYTLEFDGDETEFTKDTFSNDLDYTGNAIVKVDWSFYSRTPSVAEKGGIALAKWLIHGTTDGSVVGEDFVSMPIHFIGHSRGAYVNNSAIKYLGEQGIWVDQATTLDAQGLGDDGVIRPWDNIRFADNYFQANGGLDTPAGFSIAGHAEKNLVGMNIFNSSNAIKRHALVHTWYQGTVETQHSIIDDEVIDRSLWYKTSGKATPAGFNYSHYIGGKRPRAGLASEGAPRDTLVATEKPINQWCNAEIASVDTKDTYLKGIVRVGVRVKDATADCVLSLSLDSDTNSFNEDGSSKQLILSAKKFPHDGTLFYANLDTKYVDEGDYYFVKASTVNMLHVRRAYSAKVYVSEYSPPAPSNDYFYNRIILKGKQGFKKFSNCGATAETNEPYVMHVIGGKRHTVWWSWRAPGNGILKVKTVGDGFGTRLGVYKGNPINLNNYLYDEDGGKDYAIVYIPVVRGNWYEIGVDGLPDLYFMDPNNMGDYHVTEGSFNSRCGNITLYIDWSPSTKR